MATQAKFKEITPKQISDTNNSTEVLTALSFSSKDEVNRLVAAALKSDASETRPAEDYGFMFGRSFNDLDGHIWEAFWMDPHRLNKVDRAETADLQTIEQVTRFSLNSNSF